MAFLLLAATGPGCDDPDAEEKRSEAPAASPSDTAPPAAGEKATATAQATDLAPAPHLGKIPEFDPQRLHKHAAYLASEACQGRLSGTPGCQLARDYIVKQFRAAGLRPGVVDDQGQADFLQPFSFVSGVTAGPENALAAELPSRHGEQAAYCGKAEPGEPGTARPPPLCLRYRPGRDFGPLRMSAPLPALAAEVVFAGYGIKDAKAAYDDYAGLEVKGKVVLVLRGEPETAEGRRVGREKADPHAAEGVYADLFYKAATARDQGAAALVLVTGYRNTTEAQRLELIGFAQGGRIGCGLPVLQVSTPAAEDWLRHTGRTLKERQAAIDAALKPQSEALAGVRLRVRVDVVRLRGNTENILGVLPGQDPVLGREVLVIGAHYDHLGLGNEFSLADKDQLGKAIHYGADDNASGVAGLIELARALGKSRSRLKRTVWFCAFSAEELGTLGSIHFVDHPPRGLALGQIAAMLNLDMIGRCRERKLMVAGIGTGSGFEALLRELNDPQTGFQLHFTDDGFGGSDQLSFVNKGVPVLFFFTGSHAEYHKPTDTVEKLDLQEMARISRYVYRIAERLDQQAARPVFKKLEPEKRAVTGMGGVRMGTLPDYAFEGKGMRLSGVRGGSPADKAGLKAGDVIVELGGKRVENIYDYMNALKQCRPGNEVPVTVLREGAEVKLKAIPEQQ